MLFWPYSQSSLALFACIPTFGQAVIRIFNCLSIDKEEITASFTKLRLLLSKLVRLKYPEVIYSHEKVRQPCLYFKDSGGVFVLLFSINVAMTLSSWSNAPISYKKMHSKMSTNCRPFCFELNVFNHSMFDRTHFSNGKMGASQCKDVLLPV